jgi:hypothetical protein
MIKSWSKLLEENIMERNGRRRVESYKIELYIKKRKSRERIATELCIALIEVYSPDYNTVVLSAQNHEMQQFEPFLGYYFLA